MTATTTAPGAAPGKDVLFQAATANEWGQITGLEPNAHYFVLRKPTKELTREKSEEFVADLRAFLHQRRETTEKQVRDLNEKYGATAKAKAQEMREQLERRFEELTREFEHRVEKLEQELGERADRIFAKAKPAGEASQGGTSETPGEMPRGDEPAATGAEPSHASESSAETEGKAGRKKGGKKSE